MIQYNPSKNHSKLFCGYQKAYSKVYTDRQKIQKSQYNFEVEQLWDTDSTQLQDGRNG